MARSLCSGCFHYYSGSCDKTLDQMTLIMVCDKFKFVTTKHFSSPEQLQRCLQDYLNLSNPSSQDTTTV